MDFYSIRHRMTKTGVEIYPDFQVMRSKDLMVRSKNFYAIWDQEANLWSTDEYDVQRLVDLDLRRYAEKISSETGVQSTVRYLGDFSTNSWRDFRAYVASLSDSSKELDTQITFSNTPVAKEDYVSRRLPYPLEEGNIDSWDSLTSTLYDPEERQKFEWAIGAVISGDSRYIQKFIVFYGAPGTGKSTIINVIQALFEGYTSTFDAKALGSSNNSFAMEAFKSNPLVAIQHDGDLSRIEDNTKLNSIISHEDLTINEKFRPTYTSRINAFLFMGTNSPVKIGDAKSGMIRRLIDVVPSGRTLPPRQYHSTVTTVYKELGAIAYHCLQVYRSLGRDFYASYRPEEMMLQTDVFFNFIEAHYQLFKSQDGVSLAQAWELYKTFIADSGMEYKLAMHKVRDELRNYFEHFHDRIMIDGTQVRSWYGGFKMDRFRPKADEDEDIPILLPLEETTSSVDDVLADCIAQYANPETEFPSKKWDNVKTTLKDLDTNRLHYVKPPQNHIVIDFDLTDVEGKKSMLLNLEAAAKWPPTYAELSKGGNGVHLHYIYTGDVSTLSSLYEPGIEVKVFADEGRAALRRRVSKCNNLPVATFTGSLPQKEKKVLNQEVIKTERGLRSLIDRNLRKEIHPGTKPSVDFIKKILDDAYESGMVYDVTDLKNVIMVFASRSTNQALACLTAVSEMKFASETETLELATTSETPLVAYDVEVFPNLFILSFKVVGATVPPTVLYNPTPTQVEEVLKMRLIGYNCRRYDNHIMYARLLGYNNAELYTVSKRIINKDNTVFFREAYNLSYVDIFDYMSEKKSLKYWQIALGMNHVENHYDWDIPLPEEFHEEVGAYCANDVETTIALHLKRASDFNARLILSELSGLAVNATTQKHTAQIVFGGDRDAQSEFVYTDLSEMFPGYTYDFGKSYYKDTLVGEGGYVYAEPGIYEDVALLDVTSMHPTSIENLNLFGPYTKNFSAIKEARIAIKHGDYELAGSLLDGKLKPYLKDPQQAEALSYALKIVINIVYGLTSAKFDNPFRDRRNIDNIVAKRGALFMIDLKEHVQNLGFPVAHIKTDSIKIPGATQEIIDEVFAFGKKYGYDFEHEATYQKFCLVNDAVYVSKTEPSEKNPSGWSATGAQFQHPYVFKKLFSQEPLTFDDYTEVKQVSKGHIFLDFDSVHKQMFEKQEKVFIGKIGRFVPVTEESGGGLLWRINEGKEYAVAGTKGYFWKEAGVVQTLGLEADIDMSYFEALVDAAVDNIQNFGSLDSLVGN